MQTLIDRGIAFVIAIQSMGDGLIAPMHFFSYLGTEDFFFLALPLIYWSIDSALGLRVGFILVTSSMFNYMGKLLFAGPRPYWVSSHVRALWAETSFGVPSGHAQNAMSVWGIIAASRRQVWVRVGALLLIFLIGFSRIYLGAHFPHDVIVGWLFGAVLLWAFVRFWDPAAAWLGNKTFRQQTMIAFIVSMVFVAMGLAVVSLRSSFQLPVSWVENALRGGNVEPAPVDPNGIFTSAGTFFGLAFGLAWIASMGGYQASGPVWMRVLRYVIGLIGVLILWMGLGEIFPRGDGALVYSLRFVRYALVGWWVTGGAPWVFMRFKLIEEH
ncbi:MAG: phosphatase PAP2 family protein [Anaerolineales bacterium]|nr:phosphatase PAP2 family protein [Anaerolineales bacterium]